MVQLGVVFPQLEIGADPAGVRDYAQAAQDIGYGHLVAYDHVLGADRAQHPGFQGTYDLNSLFHEPFVLFGYLAGVAPKLELVTGVIVLPQRQTALVAKQAAAVDVLTGGKTRLGVGIGWNTVEYEALGMTFKNRARRFEEQIELMRRLWTEPCVTFEGRYHKVTAAGLNPMPFQRPIPIWIGAREEVALKRCAELADGFLGQRPFDGVYPPVEKMKAWREAVGKSWEGFGLEARLACGTRTPEEWRSNYELSLRNGATHVEINTMGGGLTGPEQHVERIREVWQAIR